MRRPLPVLICLLFGCAAISARGVAQALQKPGDARENVLVKVAEPAAVPERCRAGFATITARDSRILLSYLASDLLEGRETGTRGYRLAADYAASLFALWRLEPAGDEGGETGRGYLQEVVMKEYADLGCTVTWREGSAESGGRRSFREGVDLENYYLNRVPEDITAPVVFAGYGITERSIGYDDLAGVGIAGKIVMILDEVPGQGDPASPFMKAELRERYRAQSSWMGRFIKANGIATLGPKAVLVIRNSVDQGDIYAEMGSPAEDDERPLITEPSRLVTLPGARRGGGCICITREMADVILSSSGQSVESLKARISSRWRPASFEIAGGTLTIQTTAGSERLLRCHNVVGVVPGSDPRLKNEAVIIGAHLDHLGKRDRYVFNGADDNASGAAGVLEIARAVASSPQRPKRSMVFCLWTGEELNLLGSTFYAGRPAFPLERTVAYLNLDMIGRAADQTGLAARLKKLKIPEQDQKTIAPDSFVEVAFAAGLGLGEILYQANQSVGLDLWQKAEETAKSSGIVSDYLPFARAHVPYIYWEGPRHRDYHQTGDSPEKVDPERMAKIIRLAYLGMVALADR
jgi:hypothetical protein